jgi:hypothetical protein
MVSAKKKKIPKKIIFGKTCFLKGVPIDTTQKF